DVLPAVAREGCAVPVGPALGEGHAGDRGHQVELGGPGVAELAAAMLDLAVVADEVVMRCASLGRDVERVGAEGGGTDVERHRDRAGRKATQVGYPQLHDEAATGHEVSGGVAERAHPL